jgi:opacity protein-like surface antigen
MHQETWGCGCYEYTKTYEWGVDFIGTVALRAGFLLGENVLVYGRVGLAYGQFSFSKDLSVSNGHNTWSIFNANARVAGVGLTYGGGVEFMLPGGNVSLGLELRRTRFNNLAFGIGGNDVFDLDTVENAVFGRITLHF